jgi:RimJ/RimL family protein N-acetyltransferase
MMVQNRIKISGGKVALVRKALPGDFSLIQEMHRRLSPASLYFRYLRSYTPTPADIQRICHLGEAGRTLVALLEMQQPSVIGMAYYVVEDSRSGRTAEAAILVEDRYQGQGVGRFLFQRLVEQAQEQGVDEFHLYVHPANQPMLQLIQNSGHPYREFTAYGTCEVRMLLMPAMAIAA